MDWSFCAPRHDLRAGSLGSFEDYRARIVVWVQTSTTSALGPFVRSADEGVAPRIVLRFSAAPTRLHSHNRDGMAYSGSDTVRACGLGERKTVAQRKLCCSLSILACQETFRRRGVGKLRSCSPRNKIPACTREHSRSFGRTLATVTISAGRSCVSSLHLRAASPSWFRSLCSPAARQAVRRSPRKRVR